MEAKIFLSNFKEAAMIERGKLCGAGTGKGISLGPGQERRKARWQKK
jgi:hypothetical protein